MVDAEVIKIKTDGSMPFDCQLLGLERRQDGKWVATFEVSLTAVLDDTRTIVMRHQVQLRGTQVGRRPHPNPFGRNNKKKARKAKAK